MSIRCHEYHEGTIPSNKKYNAFSCLDCSSFKHSQEEEVHSKETAPNALKRSTNYCQYLHYEEGLTDNIKFYSEFTIQ